MLYVCIIIMYHVNAQGVDERMINVHFRERGGEGRESERERERKYKLNGRWQFVQYQGSKSNKYHRSCGYQCNKQDTRSSFSLVL